MLAQVCSASPVPFEEAIQSLDRPADDDPPGEKRGYGTRMANALSEVVGRELLNKGLPSCRPDPISGEAGERRFAGGIGAKKVDVSFATEEAGLILGISLKGIYFPDISRLRMDGTIYFAKNLTNRKGDLLAESTTLHKRFPYAVLGGLFLMDRRAADDDTPGRLSTYRRAHQMLSSFADRDSHTDADEKYESLAVGIFDTQPSYELAWAGEPDDPITFDDYLDTLLHRVAEYNPDHFEWTGERIVT